jgi:hypothetical protein
MCLSDAGEARSTYEEWRVEYTTARQHSAPRRACPQRCREVSTLQVTQPERRTYTAGAALGTHDIRERLWCRAATIAISPAGGSVERDGALQELAGVRARGGGAVRDVGAHRWLSTVRASGSGRRNGVGCRTCAKPNHLGSDRSLTREGEVCLDRERIGDPAASKRRRVAQLVSVPIRPNRSRSTQASSVGHSEIRVGGSVSRRQPGRSRLQRALRGLPVGSQINAQSSPNEGLSATSHAQNGSLRTSRDDTAWQHA